MIKRQHKKHTILPGFGFSLGITLTYISILALLPIAALVSKGLSISGHEFLDLMLSKRILAAFQLSFATALAAAALNAILGFIIAWVLVRYKFPGRQFFDSIVDLPFALPTAVAGIALTTLYSRSGLIGSLLEPLGIKVAYTPLGIIMALSFVGLPFVIRSIQPVLQDCQAEVEEAAKSLGAGPWTTLRKVLWPEIRPALITGSALSFARALGEYGSVVFIAGNMPMRTEIVPLLIMTKLEQFDYASASAIALAFLSLSFVIMLITNFLQWWFRRKYGI